MVSRPRTDGPVTRTGRGPLPRPRPRETVEYAVSLAVESVDPVTGVLTRRLVVEDESDASPTREEVQRTFAAQDALLRRNPDWAAAEVVDGELVLHNDASRWFYTSPSMREWRRDLVPRASALYPVQRPHERHLPSGGEVDATARSIFTDCLDSIGIRTRARVLKDIVRRAALASARRDGRASWVSLACGAAVPVLDAVRGLQDTAAADPHLHLVDVDVQALDFARRLALAEGLQEAEDFTLRELDLVTGIVARARLVDELGEGSADVVDAVGIFEYFRDASCVRLLRNAYRLLRPGGVLVVANMLADRRELDLNQRAIGWPRVHPRSPEQLVDLVRRAGLPLERTTISIPADGVYAVLDVRR